MQLVERREAARQREDQRLDRSGDIRTGARRPCSVSRGGLKVLKQLRAGKESVGPELRCNGDHSTLGDAAVLMERAADVHLVDDDVLEHGQRRQAWQVRASEKHAPEV